MPSSTVENYLKQIFLEQQINGNDIVAMGKLSERMEVSPGTATSMVKLLDKSGLVNYEPRNGSILTNKGSEIAIHVLRRHRLIELFLVKELGLDWSEVHEEAETLEHSISDKVLEKIDIKLGHPSVDPHGDPIPSAEGKIERKKLVNLADCHAGQVARIGRILDQNSEFLKFINKYGIRPGQIVEIKDHDTIADAVNLAPKNNQPVTLGMHAASKISVEIIDKSSKNEINKRQSQSSNT